ncbi:hypothetical protein E2C01_032598 [Portunus trituberculatus]|uniref:Uncharacterized protein n=1 Tax=Portunus trituberculatus TaxID=210409 RepID=A0A5B7F1D7_PORTR|nr:hypothetical protein [Portunus trituberculatus]
MDLYLLSPVFLKRLMTQRPSGTPLLEDGRTIDVALPSFPSAVQRDEDQDDKLLELWQRRRRSTLDRLLRQHAYIIIYYTLCYVSALARPCS